MKVYTSPKDSLTNPPECTKFISPDCSKSREFKTNLTCIECFRLKATTYARLQAKSLAFKRKQKALEEKNKPPPPKQRLQKSFVVSFD